MQLWIGAGFLLLFGAWSAGCGDDSDNLFENSAGTGGAGQGGQPGADASAGQGGAGGSSGGAAGQGGAAEGGSAGTSTGGNGGAGTGGGAGGGTSNPSLTGKEFWAVDLPNERFGAQSEWTMLKPISLLIVSYGNGPANVIIEQNNASPGQPPQLSTAKSLTVSGWDTVTLPAREVNGWTSTSTDPPGPPDTFLSSNAWRVTSNTPVSVVQLNSLEMSFSNDATTLYPAHLLTGTYHVVGHRSANPIAYTPMTGIPDHASIAIVGTAADTEVKVTLAGAILGDGAAIPKTAKGGTVQVKLGAFEVLHLASDGEPGELTGSVVVASKPVAVFSSVERLMPKDPASTSQDDCCTEHGEEQVPPDTLLGTRFLVPHSPFRSQGANVERDKVRIMAAANAATVSTSLSAPDHTFTLQPGEFRDLWTATDVTVSSTAPVLVAQFLVPKMQTPLQTGDPTFVMIPPLSLHQGQYRIAVPPGWTENRVVIATPTGNTLLLDGSPLAGACTPVSAGTIDAKGYSVARCPVMPGYHTVSGSAPFGLLVYGYAVGSAYSFAAAGM